MKSLKTQFFLSFVGLGLMIGLTVGVIMYVHYTRYIKNTYGTSLTQAVELLASQETLFSSPDILEQGVTTRSGSYWSLHGRINTAAEIMDMAYVYLVRETNGAFQFLLSSEDTPGTPSDEILSLYEDPPEALARAWTTGTPQMADPYTDEYGSFISVFWPVTKNGVVVSVLGADYNLTDVTQEERNARTALLFGLIAAVLLSGIGSWLMASSIIVPIREVEQVASTLARLDFSVHIPRFRTDEIGQLQHALIKIRDELNATMTNLNTHLDRVTGVSTQLNGLVEQSSTQLETITSAMDAVQTQANAQIHSVQSASDTVEGIISHIDALYEAVQLQTGCISESTTAVQEMVNQAGAVRQVALETGGMTQNLRDSSEEGKAALARMAEACKTVAERTSALNTANTAIAAIAAQTNLLAMNAAIEAAHAGAAGQGFAVVAGEVRSLAERSAKGSGSITGEIKAMDDLIQRITTTTDETVDTMEGIFQAINSLGASFGVVTGAVEKQSAVSSQVMSALQSLRTTAAQVQTGAEAIHKGSGAIKDEIRRLATLSQELTESVSGVREASQHIAASLDQARGIM